MRLAERRTRDQSAAVEQPGDAVDHADLQRLARGKVGQQPRQSRGQHGFAGTRRADQQQVVAARGGDLQRALGDLHSLYVAEVGPARHHRQSGRVGRGQHLIAAKVIDKREQVGCGQHLDLSGPGRLPALAGGADQSEIARRSADRGRQHAGDGVQSSIEMQLAQRCVTLHLVARQHVHRGQHAERDRQVVVAAFLQEVGRREIDEEPARRQRETHCGQGRAHPFPRLAHRLVRQADDEKGGQPSGDLHLHFHRHRLDPREGEGADARDRGGLDRGVHEIPCVAGRG